MWAYVVAGGIVLISLFITVPFCRWLCPLAAVLNPFARLGLVRVSRDTEACVDCGKCAKRCPMAIPVDERLQVKEARCTLCLDCVEACPERKSGALVFGALPGASGGAPGAVRRGWSQAAVIFIMLTCLTAAVGASYSFPLPSFVHVQGESSTETKVLDVNLENLGCRGNASLLVYFLERDDELELSGYFKLEAWPGPGLARARIVYDPAAMDEEMIKMAITEPYFDYNLDIWRESPFVIEGYDPLDF
jgi:NAD-dependent dihydropyrimidine dehydrogenase PreA subunit